MMMPPGPLAMVTVAAIRLAERRIGKRTRVCSGSMDNCIVSGRVTTTKDTQTQRHAYADKEREQDNKIRRHRNKDMDNSTPSRSLREIWKTQTNK